MSKRDPSVNVNGTLTECQYVGDGVTARRLGGRDSISRKSKSGLVGFTNNVTGKKPRNPVKLFRKAEGLLTYSFCEVDKRGKDNDMRCNPPGIKNVNLKLVNKLDVEADKWRPAGRRRLISGFQKTIKSGRSGVRIQRVTARSRSTEVDSNRKQLIAARTAKSVKKTRRLTQRNAQSRNALRKLPANVRKVLERRHKNVKLKKTSKSRAGKGVLNRGAKIKPKVAPKLRVKPRTVP